MLESAIIPTSAALTDGVTLPVTLGTASLLNNDVTSPIIESAAKASILDSVLPGTSALAGAIKAIKGKSSRKKAKQANQGIANYNNKMNEIPDVLSGNLTDLANQYKLTGTGSDNSDLYQGLSDYITNVYNNAGARGFRGASWDQLFGGFYNSEQEKRKNDLQSWFDNTFSGFGSTNDFLNNYWKDSADDAFNKNYLDEYYNNALNQLDTARNRGLLNESGYNTARNALDRRNNAAQGEINLKTDAVINNYLDDLADRASKIQTDIDDYSLSTRGSQNIDNYTRQMNDLYQNQQDKLEANLNNAVSGYTPFIVSDILGNARDTQGILTGGEQNPELLQSLQDQRKTQQNKIGLGNQGIF